MSDPADTRAAPPSHALRWPVATAKKLARVIPDAVKRFFADQCPQQAAGIAYRVLFSIAPLAIVLVSIFGLVLQDDSVRRDVVDTIVDALPVSAAGRHDVEDAITAIATPASAAGLVSLLVFAWAASGMMTAIREGLERALDVTETRPPARGKLVDLLLIVGAAVLVLVTVGITLLGNLVQRSSGNLGELIGVGAGTLASGLVHAASFVLSIVVVLLLYRFVPPRRLRFRDGLVGAIVTAVLLRLISLASGWIYESTTRLSVFTARSHRRSSSSIRCISTPPPCCSVQRWRPPGRGPSEQAARRFSPSSNAACSDSSSRGRFRPTISRFETRARTGRRARDRGPTPDQKRCSQTA